MSGIRTPARGGETPPPPSAFRIGLPDVAELEFFGDGPMRDAHLAARARIEHEFSRTVQAPFGPFLAAGELLYQGPWVAERLAEFGDFLAEHPDSILPVIRDHSGRRREILCRGCVLGRASAR